MLETMALKEFRAQSVQQRGLTNMNIASLRVSSSDLPGRQMFHGVQQFSDKFSLSHDDGYSTDTRSNTTASIYSPLSSSLSSLSTSEGSPNSGTLLLSTPGSQNSGQKLSQMQNVQPGPIPKGPNLHVASKTLLSRNGVMPVRRRGVKAEEPDNLSSLEDRLRALTTIDEEDLGLSVAHRAVNSNSETDRIAQNMGTQNMGTQNMGTQNMRTQNMGTQNMGTQNMGTQNMGTQNMGTQNMGTKGISSINHMDTRKSKITIEGEVFYPELNKMPIYYQAVPGAAATGSNVPSHSSVAERSEIANGGTVYNHLDSGGELIKGSVRKYTDFFQKQSVMPPSSINTAAPRKVSNINASSSAFADFQKHPRIDSSRFYREQGDSGIGVVNPDGRDQFLENQSFPDGGLNQGLDKNGYRHKENDGTSGIDDHRMSYTPHLSSYDPLVYDVQGYPPHAQMQQHGSQLYGQGQPNYIPEQKLNTGLVVADQHVDFQKSYVYKVDKSPGNTIGNRVSYPSQGYPSCAQPLHATSGTSMAGLPEQASWQQLGSSFDQQHLSESRKLTKVGLERNSLDLGNIPRIHKQIRAVSELCLQASRKHMFASSADIHKLFSGQNKQPAALQTSTSTNDQEDDQFCDTGIHCSEMGIYGPGAPPAAQDSFQPTPKLQVIIPPDTVAGKPLPDPFRADHNLHIPPEAWINVTSVPSSVPPEEERVYIHLQNQPMSPQSSLDRPSFQNLLSPSADFSTDRSRANCLSSGYSSESELQQIESNAEAIKKLWTMQRMEKVTNYQVQEFQPLQQSLDHDSNMERDNYDDMSESEAVYENQSALTHTYKSDPLYQPLHPAYFSQNTSSLPQSSGFSSNAYSTSESVIPASEELSQPRSSRNSSLNMFRSNSDITTHNSNIRSMGYNHTTPLNSQNEAVGLGSNPMLLTVPLTSPVTHGNQPSHSHASSIQAHHFAVNQNNKNLAELKSHGSQPSFQQPYSPVLSPCGCEDCHINSAFYPHNRNSQPHVCQPQSQSGHPDYPHTNSGSSFAKLTPHEMVRILDVPFETNIICNEQGNRLSTLV